MQVDPSLNVIAIFPAISLLRLRQIGAAFIAPTAFDQERIPDFDFFFGRSPAMRKAPLQDFFVRAALDCPFRQLIIINSQKPGAPRVEEGRIFHSDKISGS